MGVSSGFLAGFFMTSVMVRAHGSYSHAHLKAIGPESKNKALGTSASLVKAFCIRNNLSLGRGMKYAVFLKRQASGDTFRL